MGEKQTKPGHYWDYREAQWVRYAAPEPRVPAPAEPADDRVVETSEAEAPTG